MGKLAGSESPVVEPDFVEVAPELAHRVAGIRAVQFGTDDQRSRLAFEVEPDLAGPAVAWSSTPSDTVPTVRSGHRRCRQSEPNRWFSVQRRLLAVRIG